MTVLATLGLPQAAVAQGPVSLELSFSNPGARAMGFGGAFAALADDATAAFANPAGLVQLTHPEASIEVRRWEHTARYTLSGRATAEPSGQGIDTVAGLTEGVSHATLTDVSFASLVIPLGRGSVAVYRHQLASFKSSFETQGIFAGPTVGRPAVRRSLDARTTVSLDITGTGLAGAYRVTETFSVGVGLSRQDGRLFSSVESFAPDDDTVESFFGVCHYLPERMAMRTSMSVDEGDWTYSGGFLWSPRPQLNVGGFYRKGPEFPVVGLATAGPLLEPDEPAGTVLVRVRTSLALPDVYGLGLSWRSPDAHLTLAAEWDRIGYSDIITSLNRNPEVGFDQTIRDADELHVGGEYAILESRPVVAVRFGAWLDPDHRLRSTSDDPFEQAYFPGGEDELHYAAGLGIAMESFQIDLGIDLSRNIDTASISLIYSF